MKWSFSIAKVADIDVRVHVTFLLLLAYWGYVGYENGGAPEAKMSVFFIMLLFLCVLLHEFGHAVAARRFGIRTPNITLYPIGGVARLERMPENPIQELVIAIAGPMVNVVIVIALWLALGMPQTHFFDQDGALRTLIGELMRVNVLLIAFNLIPAFPMDGGRVLRALLAMRMSHVNATQIAARTGQCVAVILGLIGAFGLPREVGAIPGLGILTTMFGSGPNPFLLFIAMFVFMGAQQEAAFAGMRAAVAGLRVADAMVTRFHTFLADMPLAQAVEEAQQDLQPVYPVTDAHLRAVGMVLRNELLQAAADPNATVGSLVRDIPAVRADAPFQEAFALMQQSGSAVLPVVNPDGQVVGLASLNLLSERARARR
jgi:stage IV sporulation protein FB